MRADILIKINSDPKLKEFINNNSYALFNSEAASILSEAYNIDNIKEGELLKGFVSRKKQIVPNVLDILEKK